ncbi:MAG: Gfo/Idh/MocA family oxidoreductase [Phycisphaerae bacterium]|jgi:predicted dehydrogenase|nr:Gfo/Idh/MocA family oxidoreductase [Phycisphaerae bacterium]
MKKNSRPEGHNRREFLAGAAGLTAAVLLPKAAPAAKTPAKKYRVGVIGHTGRGGYGHGLDTVWRDIPQAEVVGVADGNAQGLARAVKRTGASKGYTDYRKMLDERKPALVSIGTQNVDLHCDMVVAAAERGARGIYIEKPLCRTLEEADQMVAACRKHRVKLAVAFQGLYFPKFKVIREIIRSGKLGRVLEIRARGKGDHRGGPIDLWVLGTRMLSMMKVLGGDPLSCFANVLQDGRPVTAKDVVETKSYGIGPMAGNELHAMYRLKGGVMGYYNSVQRGGAPAPWRYDVRVFGTKGVLHIPSTRNFLSPVQFLPDPLWSPGRSGKKWIPVSAAGIGKSESDEDKLTHHGGNALAVKDLIASIEEDRQPLANLEVARTNLEMIVAVFESHRTGGAVGFPLKNRKNPMAMLAKSQEEKGSS